jgi:hypothetical protein
MYDTNRREFIKVAFAGLAMGRSVIAAEEKSADGIPTRRLGRTGEKVTIIALGGWHIGSVDDDQEAIARNFKPMTEAEVVEVLAQSKEGGSDGRIEAYKTGNFGCDWHHRKAQRG